MSIPNYRAHRSSPRMTSQQHWDRNVLGNKRQQQHLSEDAHRITGMQTGYLSRGLEQFGGFRNVPVRDNYGYPAGYQGQMHSLDTTGYTQDKAISSKVNTLYETFSGTTDVQSAERAVGSVTAPYL